MKTYGGVDVYIHVFLSGHFHAPAALPLGKYPQYPFDRRLSGTQMRSGRHGEEKILDPTGTRTPTPSATQPLTSYSIFSSGTHSMIHIRMQIQIGHWNGMFPEGKSEKLGSELFEVFFAYCLRWCLHRKHQEFPKCLTWSSELSKCQDV
jgi:hypothetical protein